MKNLFLVCPGRFECTNKESRLSEYGVKQMKNLGSLIKDIGKENFYITSSPESVAIESAKVLASELDIQEVEKSMELWSGPGTGKNNRYGNPERVHNHLMGLIDKADSLIAVSHQEISQNYPRYFLEKVFFQTDKSHLELGRGEMIHFNIEEIEYIVLPRSLVFR